MSAEHKLGKVITGKIIDNSGKELKTDLTKKKFIVLYYTASWWGDCGPVTSQLVKWYKKNKRQDLEVILVSYDDTKEAMLNYLSKKKVNFPAMSFENKGLKEILQHAERFIPEFALIGKDGKAILKNVDFAAIEKKLKEK